MTTVDPAMPVVEHEGRTLDWRPRFDERSLSYRIGAGVTKLPATGRIWKHGGIIDQGSEGACVGAGCAGEAAAEPQPVPGAATLQYALSIYRYAQRLDEWPGEAYSGTSVLAGCLTGRKRGLWTGFRWAKTPEELAAGIVRTEAEGGGPAVIGVEWRAGSYETDAAGVLRPSGDVVGGHCLLLVGFVPAKVTDALATQLAGLGLLAGVLQVGGPCFVIVNSWGPTFGKGGLAVVPLDVMRAWFAAGGEFAIPEGRAVPKTKAARKPAAAAPPVTASPDRTVHPLAWQLLPGDRVVSDVPETLGQETATVTRVRRVTGYGGEQVRVSTTAGGFTLRAAARLTVRRPIG